MCLMRRYHDNSDLGQYGPSQFGPYFYETYRGVEIVVHTLVVGFETRLHTASCHVCPISRVLKEKWPQNALESLLHTS